MTEPTSRRAARLATATPNAWIPRPELRLWLYGILVALAALGVAYGLVTIEQGGLWLALGAALLGVGNALAGRNVPRPTPEEDGGV